MNIIKILTELTEEIYPKVVQVRRHLHSHPELSGQEKNTAAFISDTLAKAGIESTVTPENAVIANLHGSWPPQGKTVAIRADIDALPLEEQTGLAFASVFPGKMHGCGHDMHTAVLIGTAMLLSMKRSLLKGNVRFLFEPAEETVGGAKKLILDGALDSPKVSSLIGLHVNPALPSGTVGFVEGIMTAASCEFILHISGKGCHGAHPDQGSDPILAASSIITALQSIASRNIPPTAPAVVTVGSICGGTKGNLIPDNVLCKGIIRALTEQNRSFIKERVLSISSSISEAMGCTCQVLFADSYPALKNNDGLTEILSGVAVKLLGEDRVEISREASMGADDFAYFAKEVPSLYFDLGVGRDNPCHNFPLHSSKFNPEESAMKTGILMESLGAIRLLELE